MITTATDQDTRVLSPAPCPAHLQLVVVVTSRVDNRGAREAIRQVGEGSVSATIMSSVQLKLIKYLIFTSLLVLGTGG